MKTRVVVTGIGIISSIGIGVEAFWEQLLKGVSGISPVGAFDTTQHTTHVGGEVKHFDPARYMTRKKSSCVGRASQMALAASQLALQDAALDKKGDWRQRTAVCMGTTMGEIGIVEAASHRWVQFGETCLDTAPLHRSPAYNIAANVAIELKLQGSNQMFTTACAAGNYAISCGFDLLRDGEADVVLAGGADTFSWIAFTGFNKVGATAPEKCQPFDLNRKGMIPGEGAAILVLETYTGARKRNAKIYAEILGCGFSCDAVHMTNPQVEGVAKCMENALAQTGLDPADVDYVSAHGTGTLHNDRTESAAIGKVFGGRKVPVSSIKSMLGHTLGAASAIEAAACCLAIRDGIVPPTINYETADPACEIDCIPNKARRFNVDIALNNGFAFGGNNSCLAVKKITQPA